MKARPAFPYGTEKGTVTIRLKKGGMAYHTHAENVVHDVNDGTYILVGRPQDGVSSDIIIRGSAIAEVIYRAAPPAQPKAACVAPNPFASFASVAMGL